MATAMLTSVGSPEDGHRLTAFGLSTELIHTALRPALSHATNRTSMALRSTPGTVLYHDAMEHLNTRLSEAGWNLVYVDHQPRLLHPDGLVSITVASGYNVANPDRRQEPRTGRKGKATRASLAGPHADDATLFDIPELQHKAELASIAATAPLWLLVHERTNRGLNLELSRPAEMTSYGVVTDWADRIMVGFMDLDGDLSIFNSPDNGDFDVHVELR